jgi:hypothetical protein
VRKLAPKVQYGSGATSSFWYRIFGANLRKGKKGYWIDEGMLQLPLVPTEVNTSITKRGNFVIKLM